MKPILDLLSLKGRAALITGATGGLGQVMADVLAELGAELVLVDRPGTDLDGMAGRVASTRHVRVDARPCDLERQGERRRLIEGILAGEFRVNVLVNNAAFVGSSELSGWSVPFEQQSIETWRRALEVNVTAAFELAQGLAPMLRQAEGASVINIGSIYGKYAPDWRLYADTTMNNPAAYGVSKAGLLQLTRWLATALAPEVRVNSISPGGIQRGQPESFVERYASRTPLGRMGSEEDFRGAVVYLATDLSRYVTGQDLAVDGGWGIW